MVLKILELGILRELTEEKEESYKGGASTEAADIPVSDVAKVKVAAKLPISHVNLVPKLPIPPVVSKKIETT